MTKEELWKNWADPSDWCEYFERGLEQTEKDFYEDLEAWYVTRHSKELNAIKEEIVKTLGFLDEAVKECHTDPLIVSRYHTYWGCDDCYD